MTASKMTLKYPIRKRRNDHGRIQGIAQILTGMTSPGVGIQIRPDRNDRDGLRKPRRQQHGQRASPAMTEPGDTSVTTLCNQDIHRRRKAV